MTDNTNTSIESPASSVSEYISLLNHSLKSHSGRVRGEVTSISSSAKAIYFTIKDKDELALLNCMIWLSNYKDNGIDLKEGDEIIVTGIPEIYAPYGKFSLKVSTIEYAGEGALKQAYDLLKSTLSTEGLLAKERKRALPEFPKRIGLITSLSGVVIQDFKRNLKKHGFSIITIDSRVEGKDAIHELLSALKAMEKQDIEVLTIMRGGGSWDSLQAFNTESVVRAIANFKVPVITGIGHDADVTLSEMVADIGRSTPTAVAEALNEPWDGIIESLRLIQNKTITSFRSLLISDTKIIDRSLNTISRKYERQISTAHGVVSDISANVSTIFSKLSKKVRTVNNATQRATGIMKSNLLSINKYLNQLPNKLSLNFNSSIHSCKKNISDNAKYIDTKQSSALRVVSQLISTTERIIATNDPKRNIELGYSLTYIDGKLSRNIADIKIGEIVTTQLIDGKFTSVIKEVE